MKKAHCFISTIVFLVIVLGACVPVTPASTPTTDAPPTQSTDAKQYLSDAIDIIERNALNSKKVDWSTVRKMAFMFEKNGKTPEDTYDTIAYVLRQLGDNHSFFLTPEGADQLNASTVEDYPEPKGELLQDGIGYVAIYEFGAQTKEETNRYAVEIQTILIELDRQSVCGWIVDLRLDRGGNMYPMIAGLGSLIGEGNLGSFKDADGQLVPWSYRDGQSWLGNDSLVRVSHPEFMFDPEKTPVAVLIGHQTASSGEATAISFRGRPNTRFFGEPSYGLTTGNEMFVLADGAAILLTTVVELDRTGQAYGGKILPDVVTPDPQADAVEWLLAQPVCQNR